jgi:tRNA(fMet)-specific endonuclease VapC
MGWIPLGDRLDRNASELAEFLSDPLVHEIPTQRDVSRIYGEIVVALRRAGTPVPTNDIWIAAAAFFAGATLLTYAPHFQAIGRVGMVLLSETIQ